MRGLPPPWPASILHNKAKSSLLAWTLRCCLLRRGSAQRCHQSLCPILTLLGSKRCPGSS